MVSCQLALVCCLLCCCVAKTRNQHLIESKSLEIMRSITSLSAMRNYFQFPHFVFLFLVLPRNLSYIGWLSLTHWVHSLTHWVALTHPLSGSHSLIGWLSLTHWVALTHPLGALTHPLGGTHSPIGWLSLTHWVALTHSLGGSLTRSLGGTH